MQKRDLFTLLNGLRNVGNLRGTKFVYAVARNTRTVSAEVEDLQKALQPGDDFTAFEQKRTKLCIDCALKDATGNPAMNGMSYKIDPALQNVFDARIEELRAEHVEAIASREKQVTEFNAMLGEECTIELYKVAVDDVPDDITAAQLTAILDMVE